MDRTGAAEVTHDKLQERQERAFAWAAEVYGDRVRSSRYQAFRTLEEMLELVQTQGLSLEDMIRTCEYVASRPVGDVKTEIGDVTFSLDIMAENLGLSVDSCHTNTLLRIRGLDPDKCRAKDDRKVEHGLI